MPCADDRGFAGLALGLECRAYPGNSIGAIVGFGLLAGPEAPRFGTSLPTPGLNIFEHVAIFAPPAPCCTR